MFVDPKPQDCASLFTYVEEKHGIADIDLAY
jgi:hypothetical protein